MLPVTSPLLGVVLASAEVKPLNATWTPLFVDFLVFFFTVILGVGGWLWWSV